MRTILHTLFFVSVVSLLVAIMSCGGGDQSDMQTGTTTPLPKELKKKVQVVVLKTDSSIDDAAWNNIWKDYSSAHSDVIVNASYIAISTDQDYDSISKHFFGADLVVVPSLLTQSFYDHSGSFYPSTTETELPSLLDQLFASERETRYWGVPILLDPVVLSVKRAVISSIGYGSIPTDWPMLFHAISVYKDSAHPYPHLVVDRSNPCAWADTIAAYFLALGFEKEIIAGKEYDPSMSEYERLNRLNVVLPGLLSYVTGSDEVVDFDDPSVDSIKAYMSNTCGMIMDRYSGIQGASESEKNDVMLSLPIQVNETPVALSYITSVAVPLEAKNPAQAESLVSYLQTTTILSSQISSHIPLNDKALQDAIQQSLSSCIIVPRIQESSLNYDIINRFLKKDIPADEFNVLWKRGLYFPRMEI